MTTPQEVIHIRLPTEDKRWVEELARRHGIGISSMVRTLLHGLHLASQEGKVTVLDMGELRLK